MVRVSGPASPTRSSSAYLADPAVAHSAFKVRHGRERRHERLGLAEENLVGGLAQDGIHAWGRMYSQLSSTMTCQVQVGNELQTMGMAEADGLLQKADERTRKQAWHGINEAWRTHQESCAAAINAIAGWRLELNRKRSKVRPVHFLDAPVHMNRLERRTLDALLDATAAARPLAQPRREGDGACNAVASRSDRGTCARRRRSCRATNDRYRSTPQSN